jgi:hypothetical protein
LTSLRERHITCKDGFKPSIKFGDVVLVHNEGPRIYWKLAVIESLIISPDGQIRAANIRTAEGKTNRDFLEKDWRLSRGYGPQNIYCFLRGSSRVLIGFQFGGIIACKLVNFSFSFIFYSIHRINYVFEQNFKFVGVCVFFNIFIDSVEIQIFVLFAGLWLAAKLGGIIACKLRKFSFSFIFYSIRRIKLRLWAEFKICWCLKDTKRLSVKSNFRVCGSLFCNK